MGRFLESEFMQPESEILLHRLPTEWHFSHVTVIMLRGKKGLIDGCMEVEEETEMPRSWHLETHSVIFSNTLNTKGADKRRERHIVF